MQNKYIHNKLINCFIVHQIIDLCFVTDNKSLYGVYLLKRLRGLAGLIFFLNIRF